MAAPRHANARWSLAFVVLAAAAVYSVQWTLRQERAEPPGGTAADAAQHGAAARRDAPRPLARLHLTPPASGVVTLAVATDAEATTLVVDGPGRSSAGRVDGDAFRVEPDGPAGPLTVTLSPSAAWIVDVGAGAEALRLDLGDLVVDGLRLGAPLRGVDGTLPRGGRLDVVLGAARSTLHVARGSRLDADLTLGAGPVVLRIDAGVHGRVALRAGAGPATVIADAAVTVALHLPTSAPPIALEGTWWRHQLGDGVTWVRSPVPADPDDADLVVRVRHHAGAPIAVVYR